MIDKIKAAGIHVIIVRDEVENERGGLLKPASDKIKANTGKIISVGAMVRDKTIKTGLTAVFNNHAGFVLELGDGEVTVLNSEQVIGTL